MVERWWKTENQAKMQGIYSSGVEKDGVSGRAKARVVHLAGV